MNKTLVGMCESCLMPFKKDPKGENREHEKFCSYCYENGKLNYKGTNLKEFQQAMIKVITDRGDSKIKAHIFAFMAGFAPRWQKGYQNPISLS